MVEFIIFSRTARTDSSFTNLREAGRLDLIYQSILTSLFVSHGIRKDVVFHGILNGPPKPPLHIQVDGAELHDVRVDEATWTQILQNVLSDGKHPGITLDKKGFHQIIDEKSEVYVLEENGENIKDVAFGENPVFVIGDQVGLPKKEEDWILRKEKKISLGKQKYLAMSCIDIINYILDARSNK
jgi:tRNA (pseudouridine54-N1)-methyltransferase